MLDLDFSRWRNGRVQITVWLMVAAGSAYAAYTTGDVSWFTLLILCTVVVAMLSGFKAGLILSAVGVSLAVVFSGIIGGREHVLSAELFFVSALWITISILLGSLSDVIDARNELSRELREQKELYRRLVEAIPDVVVFTDLRGRILFCTQNAVSMIGAASVEEMIGRSVFDILPPEEHSKFRENMQLALTMDESTGPAAHQLQRHDGVTIEIEVSGSTVHNMDGEIEGLLAVVRDVTAERENERKVASLLKDKERLLSEVQHRIKNHMTAISAFISMQRRTQKNEHVNAALLETENRVEVMHALYQQLYIQADADNGELRPFIHDVVDKLTRSFSGVSNALILPTVPEIHISPRNLLMVGIVVNELLTNALKYAFRGTEDSPRIELSIQEPTENRLEITVHDNGIGFPKAIISGEPVSGSGKGFGLSLVESYVNETNGSLLLTNEEDGARVLVDLPMT